MESSKSFKIESSIAVTEIERQSILDDNFNRYSSALNLAQLQYSNLELARKRAGHLRFKAINGLEKYLIEFEFNFEKNGGKVVWAQDASEAVSEITEILKKNSISEVTKSKSALIDEVNLEEEFKKSSISFHEVTPAEYILKQFNEKQKHFSSILIHKSSKEMGELFSKKINLSLKHNTEIHNYIRDNSRSIFENVKATILGANFVIADTGSVAITENTCDSVINISLTKILIIVAGIDKVIPSISNLDLLLSLYSSYSTGEKLNAYNTIVSGPKSDEEHDGPQEIYLVLLDNGRSKLLEQKNQRRVLSCINCGACQNVCPVYRKIGGSNEVSEYNGPAGAISSPWTKGFEENIHLSYASTLCGKCSEVCPVNINLHEQLIYNRNSSIRMKNYSMSEGFIMKGWHSLLASRKNMDMLSSKWKNTVLNKFYTDKWGKGRKMPVISEKSFREIWEERREGKK